MEPRLTTLYLCRHGESEGNREKRFGGHGPTPLSERGRTEAALAGRALAQLGVDVLYTSDLPRAAETAALIGAAIGLPAAPTSALRERSVGQLTGLTFEEAQRLHPVAYAALLRRELDVCPPDGESVLQCRTRAVEFLEAALAKHQGQRIAFVSHNVTVYQLILHILGVEPKGNPRVFFQIDNCALHHFEMLRPGLWKVIALNQRTHLSETLPSRLESRQH